MVGWTDCRSSPTKTLNKSFVLPMPVFTLNRLLLNPYLVSLLSWLVLIQLAMAYPSKFFVFGTIILTAVMPFLLTFVWLTRSTLGKYGAHLLTKWHWRAVAALSLFIYAIFAKQWAAASINHIFHVDANYLSITSTAVAALYLPLQLIYNMTLIIPLWAIITVISLIWIYAVVGLLYTRTRFWKVLVAGGAAVAFIYATNFFFTMITNIVRDRDMMIMHFALWADFNSDHLCMDAWAKNADSVLFLGGDWVLAHYPLAGPGQKLVPGRCDFSRSL